MSNPAIPANDDAQFLEFVKSTIAEEVAKANAQDGIVTPPAQAAASPIPLTLNGQTYTFNSPEEISRAVQNLTAAYSEQIANLQAAQRQPVATGAEVTGKEEPSFDINKFVEKMTTNPVEAFDYVDRARYGVDNPTQAVKEALKSKEELAEIKRVLAVYQFKDNHPEFPANPQTANLLYGIMQNQNLPFDVSGLESAYGQAVLRGLLPHPALVAQQQQQAQNFQQQQTQSYGQEFAGAPMSPPFLPAGVDPRVFNGGINQLPNSNPYVAQAPPR